MRIHHLNCGSMCPRGGRLLGGEGGPLSTAHLVCHCLLIESSGGLVLVDTGFGSEEARDPTRIPAAFRASERPRLLFDETATAQVEQLGFAAADVRHIVATHLDADHAGGLSDFPDAEVHVTAAELLAANEGPTWSERNRYLRRQWKHGAHWVEHDTGAGGERWFGFESVRALPGLDPEVLLIPLAGHSRGHTGVAVRDGEGWLLHCGDAYLHRNEVATPPSCPRLLAAFQQLTAFDRRARTANVERLRELARSHGDEVSLFSSHDPQELARRRQAPGAVAA